MKAYQAQDIAHWAIVNGKIVMFATETAWTHEECQTFLQEVLDNMKEGGSEGQFVLAVYKLKKTDPEITSSTPMLRGFTFTLFGEEDRPYQVKKSGYMQEVNERMDRFETMMIEYMKAGVEEEAEPEKPTAMDRIAGFLDGLLEMPDVKNRIALGAVGLLDKIIPLKMSGMKQPAQIAGLNAEQQQAQRQQQQQKIHQAINAIFPVDPELGDHLLKVADIAVNNPGKYKMFIGML